MTLEEFIARHELKEIDERDSSVPAELCPWDEHDDDQVRFFVNETRTIGVGVNETRELMRVVYAELGLADSGWIPLAEAFAVSGFE